MVAAFLHISKGGDFFQKLHKRETYIDPVVGPANTAIANFAEEYKEEVQRRYRDSSDKVQLHPITRILAPGGGPLFQTGQLHDSVSVQPAKSRPGKINITVRPDPQTHHSGEDIMTIADRMENGDEILVTSKIRRIFAANGFPLKRTTTVLVVPPRPVWGPALQTLGAIDGISGRIIQAILGE